MCACQVWLKFVRQFLRYLAKRDFLDLFWHCVTLPLCLLKSIVSSFYKKLRCHNGVLITAIAKKDLYFYQIRYRTFNLGDGLYHCAGSVHKWNVSIVNNE